MATSPEYAIEKMLDIHWDTNWSGLPEEAESHMEKSFEHLSQAQDVLGSEVSADV